MEGFGGVTIPQSCADKAERILNILKSQSKTIYDRSSLVAIQLHLLKGAKNVVQGEGMCGFGRVGVRQSLRLCRQRKFNPWLPVLTICGLNVMIKVI